MSRIDWRCHPRVHACVSALYEGGVIAYPTEAVWGLGCDPANVHAVQKILRLKKRSWKKGLILAAANIEQFEALLKGLSTPQIQQLEVSWPGHTTWLVEHHGKVSPLLSGIHPTIALRVSDHPVVKALCESFGRPIVTTSANPQSLLPARNGTTARRYFRSSGILFSPGRVGSAAAPSQIKELSSGKILR